MKTIEERAKEYAPDPLDPDYILPAREEHIVKQQRQAYIAGATEQKAIDEEVRLKNCDDMTQAEYDRELAFAEWYHKNRNGTPTFSDAIEWTRKEVIKEACEWIDKYLHLFVMKGNILYPKLAQEFRKEMEESVWK